MSMICWVLGLSPAQIGVLRATPSLATDVAMASQERWHKVRMEEIVARMTPEQRTQHEAIRAAFEANPAVAEARALRASASERAAALAPFEDALSLEKSWHMLHYLFTGRIDPVGTPGGALLTGEELGGDAGYGPARLHAPSATRAFSGFLDAQELAHLAARLSYSEMSRLGVYAIPRGPDPVAQYEDELRHEVGHYFPRLRDYVRGLSGKGYGLLTWVS